MRRNWTPLCGAVLAIFAGTVSVAAASASGDPARGAAIYARCGACHSLEVNRSGPRHCGLLGRRAGSLADFTYSEAMKKSGIVWTKATLTRFLENPLAVVPGTRMGYAGVEDRQERADLVAYLVRADAAPECRAPARSR